MTGELRCLEQGEGRTRAVLRYDYCGGDLRVHIGGAGEHIGAAALVGLDADGNKHVSVQRIPPHREDQLALQAAEILHEATGRTVCVTAGIHLDEITPAEIEQVVGNALAAAKRLASQIAADSSRGQ